MRNNDYTQTNRDEILTAMQQALRDNNPDAFTRAFDQLLEHTADAVRQDYEELVDERDTQVLAARGVRQLTSEETKYYQALGGAMKDKNPQQALANLDVVMPKTTIDSVFEELETSHPLLSRIDFLRRFPSLAQFHSAPFRS